MIKQDNELVIEIYGDGNTDIEINYTVDEIRVYQDSILVGLVTKDKNQTGHHLRIRASAHTPVMMNSMGLVESGK